MRKFSRHSSPAERFKRILFQLVVPNGVAWESVMPGPWKHSNFWGRGHAPRKLLNCWVSKRIFPAFWGFYSRILDCGAELDSKASIGGKLVQIFQITFLNYAIYHWWEQIVWIFSVGGKVVQNFLCGPN